METSKCSCCGKDFVCSASGKCWCYEVFIPPQKLAELEEEYGGCLCQECIKSHLQEAEEPSDKKPS